MPTDAGFQRDSEKAEACGLQLKRTYFGEEECSRATMMKFLEVKTVYIILLLLTHFTIVYIVLVTLYQTAEFLS